MQRQPLGLSWSCRKVVKKMSKPAVQQPLVFQNDVAYQSQGSLGLSVGTVVETIGGDCVDDTLGGLHFVGEVVGKKVRDSKLKHAKANNKRGITHAE